MEKRSLTSMEKKSLTSPRTHNDKKDPPRDLTNTFHHAIWPFLLIAQFMGVLPVSGVREKDVTRVHFKWIYVGVLLAMVLIVFGAIDLFLSLRIVFERGLKLYTAGPVTFSLTSLLGLVGFFGLARHWPELMRQFAETERVFLEKSYETKDSGGFCFHLRLHGGLWLFGAVVEHGLSKISGISKNQNQISKCNLTVNFLENYYFREKFEIFSLIEMHMWMIPLVEWLTISKTFIWNFVDVFLMLITGSLALRFDQVHKRIRRFRSASMTDEFWLRARLDFMSLLSLLEAVDNQLSVMVLLSCANNLYYICYQVFQSFQQRVSTVDAVYFWYSLIFVLARILTTMLSASSINDRASDILTAIYEIPLDFWGIELERFYEIVASDLISISGKGFFFITRRLIFAMAGTVVTYELVLFDQVKDIVDHAGFCKFKRM